MTQLVGNIGQQIYVALKMFKNQTLIQLLMFNELID
jgi:hypothetical protein